MATSTNAPHSMHCAYHGRMARKTVVEIVDDISGESLADGTGRTIAFAFDGTEYEIDLTHAHIEEFRDHLAEYVRAARRSSASSRSGSKARSSRSRSDETAAIREWAAANGHSIATRGRIPADVLEAYRAR